MGVAEALKPIQEAPTMSASLRSLLLASLLLPALACPSSAGARSVFFKDGQTEDGSSFTHSGASPHPEGILLDDPGDRVGIELDLPSHPRQGLGGVIVAKGNAAVEVFVDGTSVSLQHVSGLDGVDLYLGLRLPAGRHHLEVLLARRGPLVVQGFMVSWLSADGARETEEEGMDRAREYLRRRRGRDTRPWSRPFRLMGPRH